MVSLGDGMLVVWCDWRSSQSPHSQSGVIGFCFVSLVGGDYSSIGHILPPFGWYFVRVYEVGSVGALDSSGHTLEESSNFIAI